MYIDEIQIPQEILDKPVEYLNIEAKYYSARIFNGLHNMEIHTINVLVTKLIDDGNPFARLLRFPDIGINSANVLADALEEIGFHIPGRHKAITHRQIKVGDVLLDQFRRKLVITKVNGNQVEYLHERFSNTNYILNNCHYIGKSKVKSLKVFSIKKE